MAKRVLVIASGRTEQLALPHLLAHLRAEGLRWKCVPLTETENSCKHSGSNNLRLSV